MHLAAHTGPLMHPVFACNGSFSAFGTAMLHHFHCFVPISFCSRKICFCTPGTPAPVLSSEGRASFLQDVAELENLLAKPAFLTAGGEDTVEVLVPRLAKDLKSKKGKHGIGPAGWESGEDAPISKKAVMRKRATMAAIAVAEAAALAEQARKAADAARFGASRHLGATMNEVSEQFTCEICFYSEAAGSRSAERLISCPNCKRVFHRNCLKQWAENRDIFNWSSWVCGSCRICEVCRRTGEPNKLMFCKRCDAAIHAYCQQPPLKQVPKGPFLCPRHTLCHGCGSRVPGSGVSSRWFLEYTMCDACGRLFIKGKYCSICLKVYRDSEASPMVCCDNCEHWVHARCDNISDEKYYEFQLNNNLHYTCAACRGDCYKVKGTGDAVEELWRRRDEAEKDLILENQAASGLPLRDENLKLCPSDDEDETQCLETNPQKKAMKVVTTKGKDQDERPFTNFESQKPSADGVGPGGASGVIKRLKITMPSSSSSKLNDSSHRKGNVDFNAAENSRLLSSSLAESSLKTNDSTAKLTTGVIHGRESTASGNGKVMSMDQYAGTKSHTNLIAALNDGGNSQNMAPSKSDNFGSYTKNPSKSVKFIDNTKAARKVTKFILHQPDKTDGSKLGMRVSSLSKDYVKESETLSDESCSDEDGSDRNSDSSEELRERHLDASGVSPSTLAGDVWDYQEDPSRYGLPSFKYCDKNHKPLPAVQEDLDSNDTSSGTDGTRSLTAKCDRDAAAVSSQDEDSLESFGRKSWNVTCSLMQGNGNTLRGQRSKRKKHHSLESHRPSTRDMGTGSEEDGELLDDSRGLQRLKKDAVRKRVEVLGGAKDGSR